MRSKLTLAGLGAVLAVALLPLKTAGCGSKVACITVTPKEYARTGSCPSVDDMQRFFEGDCGFRNATVNGEGTYDGALCCYPVTNEPENADIGCFGGFAGFAGGFVGGFGGGCASCGDMLDRTGISPGELCFGNEDPLNDILACGCANCVECELNVCKGTAPTIDCVDCLRAMCPAAVDFCESF